MGKKNSRGETQRERRSRNKRLTYARGIYGPSTAMPKDWGRAMRRHPPTTCLKCEREMIWSIPQGAYVSQDDGLFCSATGSYHHLANGKRAHRFAGNQVTPR